MIGHGGYGDQRSAVNHAVKRADSQQLGGPLAGPEMRGGGACGDRKNPTIAATASQALIIATPYFPARRSNRGQVFGVL